MVSRSKRNRRWGFRMTHKSNGANASICWVKRAKRQQILTNEDKMVTCKFCLKIIKQLEMGEEPATEETYVDEGQEVDGECEDPNESA